MNFISDSVNLKEAIKNSLFDPFLLENNEKQIDLLCNFFRGDKSVFILNGFLGAGKTAVADFVFEQLDNQVLKIRYNCLETSVVDDMMLSFFESFNEFFNSGKLIPPKAKVDNFGQKINLYFNSTDKPIAIFIDGFSAVLKNNKSEILNFIKYLTEFKNIKIVITSRTILDEDFNGINHENSTVLALSKEIFEKYLKSNNVKNIGILSNELYKQTKGYYLYVGLVVKLMKLRNYDLGEFLELYSKSMLGFYEFLLREAVGLIDPVSLHLFRLLAVMRIPINRNLLKTFNLYDKEQENFFVENFLLISQGNYLFLPDYFREIIERQIQDNVMLKLHKACVELYETQLPLKPLERDLKLSRQTMRNEIDYHSLFIPKKIILPQTQKEFEEQEIEAPIQNPEKKQANLETKENRIKKINFIVEDEGMLDNIANSIKDFVSYKEEKREFIAKTTTLSLTQLLNSAHNYEVEYDYRSAIILYQTALTKKDDLNFDTFLPTIYIKLAKVYIHLSQWYEALEYFTKAQDWYLNVSDYKKANEIKLEIAKIYIEMYKYDNAKYILHELAKNDDLSNEFSIKINLALGQFCNDYSKESEYYKKSLLLVDNTVNKTIVAELYYKYALTCDEKGETKEAVNYYKKCIEEEKNINRNPFLSKSLANIAQIYDELDMSQSAIKYYEKSIEIDKSLGNNADLYESYKNLSVIYSPRDEAKSLEMLNEAYKYAQLTNEPYYITDVLSEIGNYYFLRKDYVKAKEYFIKAYDISKEKLAQDYSSKIYEKIKYIEKL